MKVCFNFLLAENIFISQKLLPRTPLDYFAGREREGNNVHSSEQHFEQNFRCCGMFFFMQMNNQNFTDVRTGCSLGVGVWCRSVPWKRHWPAGSSKYQKHANYFITRHYWSRHEWHILGVACEAQFPPILFDTKYQKNSQSLKYIIKSLLGSCLKKYFTHKKKVEYFYGARISHPNIRFHASNFFGSLRNTNTKYERSSISVPNHRVPVSLRPPPHERSDNVPSARLHKHLLDYSPLVDFLS